MATVAEALALGRTLHQQGDLARAEPIDREVLAREPRHAAALNLLGLLAVQASRMTEGLALLEQSGVRWFSLQKGPGIEQISALPAGFRVVDLGSQADNESGAFMDTAAILKNLELLVTSDTSCAHLAGALGVPVWIALRASPDWRWASGRDGSPWYPAARLFRQTTVGDWGDVFRSMARELRQKLPSV